MEQVILVDENDKELGVEEKLEAHRQGKLHRCFSIFIFNEQEKVLLQKRNKNKYHSGGLWSNTCCSHPRPGEQVLEGAHRRLKEEMGFDCGLKELFTFVYKAHFDNGLTEHEYDHVVVGQFNGRPGVNPAEVEDWKWMALGELKEDMQRSPEKYTYWLKASFDDLCKKLNQMQSSSGESYQQATAAVFFSHQYREDIEKALKQFLPEELTAEWAEAAVGKARWKYDANALTKSISEPTWDLLNRGGKRLRPLLMLLCCEAVGGQPENILPFTVIPEIIHNGTLMADDIEDNSDLRRGKPAVHKLFGIDITINASSALYFLPFVIVRNSALPDEIKLKAYGIITAQVLKCHFGQAVDIYWHSGKSGRIPSEEEYLQMCANKSGSLTGMAAKLGALLGGGAVAQIEALGRFAEAAGAAFQIKDDILNIEGAARIGKEFGDDIREGKRTLLVIHTLNIAQEKERLRLVEVLNMHTGDEKLLAEAIAIIKRHNAIAYAGQAARKITEEAWSEVDTVLPESAAKKQLRELADLMLSRKI